MKFDLRTLFHWTTACAAAMALGFYGCGKAPRDVADGMSGAVVWLCLILGVPAYLRFVRKLMPKDENESCTKRSTSTTASDAIVRLLGSKKNKK